MGGAKKTHRSSIFGIKQAVCVGPTLRLDSKFVPIFTYQQPLLNVITNPKLTRVCRHSLCFYGTGIIHKPMDYLANVMYY